MRFLPTILLVLLLVLVGTYLVLSQLAFPLVFQILWYTTRTLFWLAMAGIALLSIWTVDRIGARFSK